MPSLRCRGREVEDRLRHRFERSAMYRTRPVLMQFQEVEFGAVTFVLAGAVLRETGAAVAHNRIARHFGDHTRSRDGEAVAIAVDDRRLRQGEGEYREAVD